jgi:hypothetical protein
LFLPLSAFRKLNQTLGKSFQYFSYFKAKFDAEILFFQFYHFLGTARPQMEEHKIALNEALLNNQAGWSFTPSMKRLVAV